MPRQQRTVFWCLGGEGMDRAVAGQDRRQGPRAGLLQGSSPHPNVTPTGAAALPWALRGLCATSAQWWRRTDSLITVIY